MGWHSSNLVGRAMHEATTDVKTTVRPMAKYTELFSGPFL